MSHILKKLCLIIVATKFSFAAPVGICLHAYSPEAPADKIECFEFAKVEQLSNGSRFFLEPSGSAVITKYRLRGVIYYRPELNPSHPDFQQILNQYEQIARSSPSTRRFLNTRIVNMRFMAAEQSSEKQYRDNLPKVGIAGVIYLEPKFKGFNDGCLSLKHRDGTAKIQLDKITVEQLQSLIKIDPKAAEIIVVKINGKQLWNPSFQEITDNTLKIKHEQGVLSLAVDQISGENKKDILSWPDGSRIIEKLAQAEREKLAQAEREKLAQAEQEKRSRPGSKAGEERDFEIAPGVSITMCWIPPGEFLMGSPTTEEKRQNDETQHQVKISKGFWLAKTETTQAQWQAVMGNNPSDFIGKDLPVEQVSWNNIAGPGGFMEKVNQASSGAGAGFNLPTEAQWEYACRAGTTGPYAGSLDQMAWYGDNSKTKTHPVGRKKANAWGLHDMHGNVWEWCLDRDGSYPREVLTDPHGAASGTYRGFRGGSWYEGADYCRAAFRGSCYLDGAVSIFGFRIARSPGP